MKLSFIAVLLLVSGSAIAQGVRFPSPVNVVDSGGNPTINFYTANSVLRATVSSGATAAFGLKGSSGTRIITAFQTGNVLIGSGAADPGVPLKVDGIGQALEQRTELLNIGVPGTAYATHWQLSDAVVTGANHLYLKDPSGATYIDFDGIGNRNSNFLSNIAPVTNNFYSIGSGSLNWADVWTNGVQSSAAATMTIGTTVAQAISMQVNSTERIRLASGSALATITADTVPATDKGYALGSGSLHWSALWSDTIVSATSSSMTVGTTNSHSLNLETNGSTRLAIDSAGLVTVTGNTSFTTLFGVAESAANGVGASITGNFPLGLINNGNGTASQNAWFVQIGTGTVGLYSGSGSPETVVTAAVGSIYMRTGGGAGTSIYIKESGSGATGWISK